jgi:metacaspase-1
MARKALLCGVNEYQIPGANLRGCVNDVENIRGVLEDVCGFEASDITVLINEQVTKAAIETELAKLVSGAAAGDVLYFHFSGHGSNVADKDGDEPDGRDEIFCPNDLDWDDPLLDDSIRKLLDGLPAGANLTFVSDCCHSGTITRALEPPDVPCKQRYLPDPRDLRVVESGRTPGGAMRGRANYRSLDAPSDINDADLPEMLITGCRADQTSADAFIDNDYHGALTHSLAAALRESGGKLTYRQLHADVLQRLEDGGYDQTPQLEGRSARFDLPFLEAYDA